MPAALSPRRIKAEQFIRLRQLCYLWTFVFSGIALVLLLVTTRRSPRVGSLAVFVLSIGINVAVMVYCFMLNFWAVVFQRRSAKEANQTKIVKRVTILFHWVITVVVTVMFALLVRFYPAPKCNGKDGVWSSTVVGKPDPEFKKQCTMYLAGWTIYGFELIGTFVGSMLVLVTNAITRWAENEDDLAARQARIDEKKRAVATASTATPSTASQVAPLLQSSSKASSARPSRAPTIDQSIPPMRQQRLGGSTSYHPTVDGSRASSSHRSSPLATQPVIVSHRPSPLATQPVRVSDQPSSLASPTAVASPSSRLPITPPAVVSPGFRQPVTPPGIASHGSRRPISPPTIASPGFSSRPVSPPAVGSPGLRRPMSPPAIGSPGFNRPVSPPAIGSPGFSRPVSPPTIGSPGFTRPMSPPAIGSPGFSQPVTPPATIGDSRYTKVSPRPAQAGPRRGANYI